MLVVLLGLIATFLYSLSNSYLARYSRLYNGFVTSVYRNISITILFFPIIFFLDLQWQILLSQHWWITGMAVFGSASLVSGFMSMKYAPIALRHVLFICVRTVLLGYLGWYFLNESLTLVEIGFSILALFCCSALSLQKIDYSHLNKKTIYKGIVWAVVSGITGVGSMYSAARLSEVIGGIATGYIWEASIGILLCISYLLWHLYKQKPIVMLPVSEIKDIALYSSLIGFGTVCVTIALALDRASIVSVIMTSGVVMTMAIGWFMYDERLTKTQIGLAIGVLASVILLKLL